MKKFLCGSILIYGFALLGICIAIRIILFMRNQETPSTIFELWNWGLVFLAIGGLYLKEEKEKK